MRGSSSSPCSPRSNIPAGAQHCSPTSLAPGCSCHDPRMRPAPFPRPFPKQKVCCGLSLKKQAVTTGLSPGAGYGADREPRRRRSCTYEFCCSPAFQRGFISKARVFLGSLSLPVAQIHQRLSAPNFLLLSGGIWEPAWSRAVRLNPSYEYQNLSKSHR